MKTKFIFVLFVATSLTYSKCHKWSVRHHQPLTRDTSKRQEDHTKRQEDHTNRQEDSGVVNFRTNFYHWNQYEHHEDKRTSNLFNLAKAMSFPWNQLPPEEANHLRDKFYECGEDVVKFLQDGLRNSEKWFGKEDGSFYKVKEVLDLVSNLRDINPIYFLKKSANFITSIIKNIDRISLVHTQKRMTIVHRLVLSVTRNILNVLLKRLHEAGVTSNLRKVLNIWIRNHGNDLSPRSFLTFIVHYIVNRTELREDQKIELNKIADFVVPVFLNGIKRKKLDTDPRELINKMIEGVIIVLADNSSSRDFLLEQYKLRGSNVVILVRELLELVLRLFEQVQGDLSTYSVKHTSCYIGLIKDLLQLYKRRGCEPGSSPCLES